MSNQNSKKYYITLSEEEAAEVDQQSDILKVPAAQLIRERNRLWVQSQTQCNSQGNPSDFSPLNSHLSPHTQLDPTSADTQELTTTSQLPTNPIPEQLTNQIRQMQVGLSELRQEVQGLVENGILVEPLIEPQVRAALQPIHGRLEQVESQLVRVSELLVQAINRLGELSQVVGQNYTQIPIHFLRVEACLEILHILNQRQLIALTPEEDRPKEESFLDEIRTELQQYLEKDGRLDR